MTSPNGQPVNVSFGTATSAGGAPPVTISCSKESGSVFPIGSSTVTCTASDSRQRSDACSFDVVVLQTPKIQFTNFVAFGDSITAGDDGRNPFGATSAGGQLYPHILFPSSLTYPGVLQQTLAARYTTQSFRVDNAGKPSEEASDPDTLSRFSRTVSGGVYQVVLLMEGSNDVDTRDSRVENTAIANLRTMLRDAKSRGIRPYLATVPPMLPGTQRGALAWSLVPGFNDQVRALAASEGVTLVDVYGALNTAPSQYIGFDGLHPNEAGYAKIAETFFNTLKETLDVTPTLTTTTLAIPPAISPYSPVHRRP